LSARLLVHAPDEETRNAGAHIEVDPEMEAESASDVPIAIRRSGAFFVADLPDGRIVEGSLPYVARRIAAAQMDLLRAESDDGTILSGATVLLDDERIVLIPTGELNPAALLLNLLGRGAVIEAGNHLRLQAGAVTAWPQRLLIRERVAAESPALWEEVTKSPSFRDWHGRPVYAFAPAVPPQAWRIGSGPATHVVVLTRNAGGRALLRPLEKAAALGSVLGACWVPRSGRGATVARVAGLLSGCECLALALGDPAQAAERLTDRIAGA
jgi:hypothetical protein